MDGNEGRALITKTTRRNVEWKRGTGGREKKGRRRRGGKVTSGDKTAEE